QRDSQLWVQSLERQPGLAQRIRLVGRDGLFCYHFGPVGFKGFLPPPRLSQFVITRIYSDASQPPRKIFVGVNLIDASEQFKENVLRNVFDILSSPEKPADEPEYHRGKLFDNGLVS